MKHYLFAALFLSMLGCLAQTQPENKTGCVCTADYSPVCGIDSKTYSNACMAACSGINVSYEGECTAQGCQDSDGGKNTSIKGSVSAGGLVYTDYCLVFGSVEEYFCENNLAQKETIGCQLGFECRGGACVEKIASLPTGQCTDSDEQDLYTTGTVNASGAVYVDSCNDLKLVKEYYCQDGKMQEIINECPPGYRCDRGSCAKESSSCTDTDSGKDIMREGKVTVSGTLTIGEYLDKCVDGSTVREYYCQAGGYAFEEIKCPDNFRCINAACKEDLCTDSDEGYSIFQKGAVNKGSDIFRDTCTGESSGMEYYCDNNNVMNATFECATGYVCGDGACEKVIG